MTETTHDRAQLERLIFFSDAVFAIAMTLLVVDVRLPHVAPITEATLAQALLALFPQYIGFLVSFLVVGQFWIGHHRVFGQLARSDDTLVWRNLLFLLVIAFMPFPTTLISQYASTRVGTGVYAAWLTLAGLVNVWVERHALAGPLMVPDRGGPRTTARGWTSVLIGVLAFAAAMVSPLLGLVPLTLSPVIVRLVRRRATAPALPPP
jgi:uncharacterized membrane protein